MCKQVITIDSTDIEICVEGQCYQHVGPSSAYCNSTLTENATKIAV